MTISHHSHSGQFCMHAKGTLEQVVQEAIRQGFTTFGLSEHVPRYRQQDLYPEEQQVGLTQLSDNFEAFIVEAHLLKQAHKDDITLLVGLETELINQQSLDELEKLLNRHGNKIEYVVGSVHHCRQRPIDFDKHNFDAVLDSIATRQHQPQTESASIDMSELRRHQFATLFDQYFDDQLTMMQTIKPEVVGHFDLCRLYYPQIDFRQYPQAWSKIERNVDFAISYGALFEVNAAAFRKGWSTAYPGSEVFELIHSKGGRFTLSDDSHGPQAVGLNYDRAYEYLREQGVQELWYLAEANDDDGVQTQGQTKSRRVVPRKVEGTPWLDQWPALFRQRMQK
ncbi:hypothetical protein OIO90_002312 [Microbotryomycetes sp. JL221]|nr:hypothetical protein OIO90_002312 [Microbotryomycetes sp. JL221]